MTDLQKKTAEAMVNIFETGRVRGRYGAVTVLKGDSGHLSYGRSQAALGSGSLYMLLKAYCEAPGAKLVAGFVPLLPRFRDKDVSLDFDRGVRDLLEEAGTDPVMRKTQDDFFDRSYWQPSVNAATACGLTHALSVGVVYDSYIQGGFLRIRNRVQGGPSVSAAVNEEAWITSYIAERKAWLESCAPPLPNTVYRVNEFARLLGKNWELELPLTVRGVVINQDVLETPEEVAVPARVPDPESSGRILQLTRPYMKGDDVKELQLALKDRGYSGDTDGVFGPMTEVLVKQFQRKQKLKYDGVVGPATWSQLQVSLTGAAA